MNEPKQVLFCLPYAGGSAAAIYGKWTRALPPSIKVWPLELAGRGRRTGEPFHADMEAAVRDLLAVVAPVARSGMPYAFYGHSMGTALVYELARALAAAALPAPRTLFLSGRNCPDHEYAQRQMHLLGDDAFLAQIRTLGGTPDEFFRMKDLVAAFLPVLRSDYRLIETYRAARPLHRGTADIVFLCGDRDPLVNRLSAPGWQACTSARFRFLEFSGGHFFINDHTQAICRVIAETLEPALAS